MGSLTPGMAQTVEVSDEKMALASFNLIDIGYAGEVEAEGLALRYCRSHFCEYGRISKAQRQYEYSTIFISNFNLSKSHN
eukprot:scaffold816_cov43-Cyclotella_meneghiniana.AAC.6